MLIKQLALLILSGIVGHPAHSYAADPAWLITPEEAAMISALEPREGERGRGFFGGDYQDVEDGPVISVAKPSVGARVKSPLEILVHFIERHAQVVLSSLKVEIVTSFISYNLTSRVMPHATTQGIDMKEAPIPPGKYTIRISLGDAQGKMSIRYFSIEVL